MSLAVCLSMQEGRPLIHVSVYYRELCFACMTGVDFLDLLFVLRSGRHESSFVTYTDADGVC